MTTHDAILQPLFDNYALTAAIHFPFFLALGVAFIAYLDLPMPDDGLDSLISLSHFLSSITCMFIAAATFMWPVADGLVLAWSVAWGGGWLLLKAAKVLG